jgi:hypothetical protein
MFKLDLSPTFRAAVRFEVQSEDGKRQVHAFDGVFPRMDTDEVDAFAKRCAAEGLTDVQAAQQLLRGWHDVCGADGAPLEFNQANLADRKSVV